MTLVLAYTVRTFYSRVVERCALNRAEYMVGMSGKVSEPRRGQSSQQKKTAVGSVGTGGGTNKTQPPPEALHVANILGDGMYPSDFGDKIAQVMSMLPACSEDEVCIALHDYDFDTNKAISALLDSDTLTSSQVYNMCVMS